MFDLFNPALMIDETLRFSLKYFNPSFQGCHSTATKPGGLPQRMQGGKLYFLRKKRFEI